MTNSEKIRSLLLGIGMSDKFKVEVDHNNDYVLVPITATSRDIMDVVLHMNNNGFKNGIHYDEIVLYKSADTIAAPTPPTV